MNRQQTAIAKRAQIIALHDEGLSSRVIAQRLAVSRTTVQNYDRRNIFEEARSGHVTVKVWGWIFIHGMGDIVRIEGRFTAAKCLEILENFFIPSLQQRNHPFPPGPIIYVQDRCPIHTAHTVLPVHLETGGG
ncbi:hypothetical protein Pcinc_009397 [Petrolisthes cinctipes]|uniref:Uncharacterized protein n=1 Tax=Petrolisthes cinctipes TaxID=88211 RepID=A0AAE1KUV0_PETCI|nr:hypothetical protein Pcinc_009397 [Petrolisthes cinctipes]